MAAEFAAEVLDRASKGRLTVVDEDALVRSGVAWSKFGFALHHLAYDKGLVWVYCGGGQHTVAEWLGQNFGGPGFVHMNDWGPDFGPDNYLFVDAPPDSLDRFGQPTLIRVAHALPYFEKEHGPAVVLLDHIAGARRYADIAHRQLDIEDPQVRDGARAATFQWRAGDLADFAATRPDAVTLVATLDADPGQEALLRAAAVVLPRPRLRAVPAA